MSGIIWQQLCKQKPSRLNMEIFHFMINVNQSEIKREVYLQYIINQISVKNIWKKINQRNIMIN